MRTHTILLALVSLLGCAESSVDPASTVLVEGNFERVDATDVTSAWVGGETITVLDSRGDVQCEADLEYDARILDAGCAKCSLTLELLEEISGAVGCAVDAIGDRTPALLSFEHDSASTVDGVGTILVADYAGDWEPYTMGSYRAGQLSWSYQTNPFLVPPPETAIPVRPRPRGL